MSQIEKLIAKLKSNPKNFKYSELQKVMHYLGYTEDNAGKTTGSAVNFIDNGSEEKESITIHKPHPGDEMPASNLKRVVKFLEQKERI
jgi:hypothetical protein